MTPFEAYTLYTAVKLHFNNVKYDYFTYNGKCRVREDSFDKRKDKYSFAKLAKNYKREELPFFLACNFRLNNKIWIKSLNRQDAVDVYTSWRKDQESRLYLFKQNIESLKEIDYSFGDLLKFEEGSTPKLLEMVYHKTISEDFFLLLDYFLKLTTVWNDRFKNDFYWQQFYFKLMKYSPFFFAFEDFNSERNKYKVILEKYLSEQMV